jgi:hypothetical protein
MPSDAKAPPVLVWVAPDPAAGAVYSFLVANGLTFRFSMFQDRFKVSEVSPGLFVAAVSCVAVTRLLRRRAAFIFAGVLFRFKWPPTPEGERSDSQATVGSACVFGMLTFPR